MTPQTKKTLALLAVGLVIVAAIVLLTTKQFHPIDTLVALSNAILG